MRKIYLKLIAMALALVLAVTVALMSSYAWLVLSGNPAVTGIQVAIGGGNTILTAPNIQETDKFGNVYSYPGRFSDKLNFGQVKEYDYLQGLGSLTPVSTYNGIDWFIPTYYTKSDPEVQSGKVLNGSMKDISQFIVDSQLEYANLAADDEEKIGKGSYVYLDFWVVAPGGDYTLRVSTGEGTETGGSFVIDLPEPVEAETESGYTLSTTTGGAAASVRIGFLANDVGLTDDTMDYYQKSKFFDERFHKLRGLYVEPNSGTPYLDDRFTIYEPNGDLHPGDDDLNGDYVETKALALVKGAKVELSVQDRLTVQRTSAWAPAQNGASTTEMEQHFQAALYSMDTKNMTIDQILNKFYGNYLQGVISPYINKGSFIQKTSELYGNLRTNGGVATKEALQNVKQAGATDDTNIYIIKLEQNVPQRIRMFIWLEGQDIDCIKNVDSTRFAVNIELAGGSE